MQDWAVFMHHSAATLDHFGVPARERDDVLGFFSSLRETSSRSARVPRSADSTSRGRGDARA